ncbi:MAG: hypothetical protein CVT48_03915 [Thermoplasmata archaeon HGW-Thermoplasmata-1]|nr:MAG: hypothetical protein CVT48_03915 [Thermoplasmata archaeon HGW-Thermoplasmata-1]
MPENDNRATQQIKSNHFKERFYSSIEKVLKTLAERLFTKFPVDGELFKFALYASPSPSDSGFHTPVNAIRISLVCNFPKLRFENSQMSANTRVRLTFNLAKL